MNLVPNKALMNNEPSWRFIILNRESNQLIDSYMGAQPKLQPKPRAKLKPKECEVFVISC